MNFWDNLKTSFAWGLGGAFGTRLGWAFGGFVTRWIKRLTLLVAAGSLAKCAAFHFAPSAPGKDVVSKPSISQPASPRRHSN